jgi:TctA family transporter
VRVVLIIVSSWFSRIFGTLLAASGTGALSIFVIAAVMLCLSVFVPVRASFELAEVLIVGRVITLFRRLAATVAAVVVGLLLGTPRLKTA